MLKVATAQKAAPAWDSENLVNENPPDYSSWHSTMKSTAFSLSKQVKSPIRLHIVVAE